MSLAKTGKVGPWKDKKRPNIGGKIGDKLRGRKLSKARRLRQAKSAIRGSKHRWWKGGITAKNHKIRHSLKVRLWRTAVFERDRYTCQECGDNRGGNLEAHHIKSFSQHPELRLEVTNGITLCKSCHKKTDSYLQRNFKV